MVAAGLAAAAALAAGSADVESAPGGARDALVLAPSHRGEMHNAIVAVRTRAPLVALTLDDGPTPRFTPRVLALLRRERAHATFFPIGRSTSRTPQLVRAERAGGHEIGAHTWSHALLPPLSPTRFAAEIDRGNAVLRRVTGRMPWSFRPPHGWFDRRVAGAVAARGQRLVGWNRALERALHGRTVRQATALLLRQIRRGDILLAHDGRDPRPRTLYVLERLLPALRRRGLRVVSVGTLIRSARPAAHPMASSSPDSLPTSSVPSPASAG